MQNFESQFHTGNNNKIVGKISVNEKVRLSKDYVYLY